MIWEIPRDLERFFTFLNDEEVADSLYAIVSLAVSTPESESQDDASSQLLRQILELIERAPVTEVVSTKPSSLPPPIPAIVPSVYVDDSVEEIDIASIVDDFMK